MDYEMIALTFTTISLIAAVAAALRYRSIAKSNATLASQRRTEVIKQREMLNGMHIQIGDLKRKLATATDKQVQKVNTLRALNDMLDGPIVSGDTPFVMGTEQLVGDDGFALTQPFEGFQATRQEVR